MAGEVATWQAPDLVPTTVLAPQPAPMAALTVQQPAAVQPAVAEMAQSPMPAAAVQPPPPRATMGLAQTTALQTTVLAITQPAVQGAFPAT